MRRFLILLCAAASVLTVLGALPARAAEPTWLYVDSYDPLLNENGDGFWESATVHIGAHADAAHWVLARGGTAVAQGDLTDTQLSQASGMGTSIPISSAITGGTPLAAGTYTFTVHATKAGALPTTDATQIYVSTAPPITTMVRSSTVFFPNDYQDGVPHEIAFRHGLDATILTWGVTGFEVIGANGPLVSGSIDARDPWARWGGMYVPAGGGGLTLAPPGVYRIRLKIRDNGATELIGGPLSQPFGLSRGYRVTRSFTTMQKASATRTATLTRRHARFSVVDGSLRYRRTGNDWRRTSLVRTAHQVRIPTGRIPGSRPALVVRGRWHDADAALEVLTRTGRPRLVSVYDGGGPGYRLFMIPRYLLRADGTVRFRVVWSTNDSTYRTGRVDSIGVRIDKWVWRDLT